ncbi:MAG: hypothetical protein DRQ88_04725 [Epsilonproteobacteria bacterium]|nr:MAG: hypothetical protein DRQ89_06910 [Campylobacterota bacterium]RLA66942.1 MAG: hypothetical protein DRQ88_04725 [Campylobacterota bacterium]
MSVQKILFIVILVLVGSFIYLGIGLDSVYKSGLISYKAEIIDHGCVSCHESKLNTTHSSQHRPFNHIDQTGCISCHLGNATEKHDKKMAHLGMIKIPGNLSNIYKTCGKCHEKTTIHVMNSLMANGFGMVSVNRYVFGESKSLNGLHSLKNIKNSNADLHLKQLCKQCHLGTEKTEFGHSSQGIRGGGCLACHMDESSFVGSGHMGLTVQVKNHNCFSCHSRSSRISTSFEGWHESKVDKKSSLVIEDQKQKRGQFRFLKDGRLFEKKTADIHHQKGFQCIDCHTAGGIMGDGQKYAHQEEQVEISCIDCHFEKLPETLGYKDLDSQAKNLLGLRADRAKIKRKYVVSSKKQKALINVFKEKGQFFFQKKITGEKIKLHILKSSCQRNDSNHKNLNCTSCHSAWAPQCISCHTQKDQQGLWNEYSGDFLSDAPTLGVRLNKGVKNIITFTPGMVMTLSQKKKDLKKLNLNKIDQESSFHRLFAPIVAHTIVKEGRSCISCHQNPNALGYGRGIINFNEADPSKWKFLPLYFELQDGLPADAWIPFMGRRDSPANTRENTRPFTPKEQRKILTVGRCLSCHDAYKDQWIYESFGQSLKKMKTKCQ